MNENELKELLKAEGIEGNIDTFVDQIEALKEAITKVVEAVSEAFYEIANFFVKRFISWFEKQDKKYMWLLYCKSVRMQQINPLYLDKRSKIHRCRNNC